RPDIRILIPRKDAVCPLSEKVGVRELAKLREKLPGVEFIATLKAQKAIRGLCEYREELVGTEIRITGNPDFPGKVSGKRLVSLPGLEGLGEVLADLSGGGGISDAPRGGFSGAGSGGGSGEGPGGVLADVFPKGLPVCQIHAQIEPWELVSFKEKHPRAEVLANVLASGEVKILSDHVGDSDGIRGRVEKSRASEFIAVSETGLAGSLSLSFPGKKFFELETEMFCPNMKLTNLKDILRVLEEARAGADSSMTLEKNRIPGVMSDDIFG
ncbi:MAG: quinolinate synthase NadA, partial [Deltaproteobacteria bacterium]|nr:quinolinate synthase NadA [Deltaproteobacteria bacterium]